MIRKYLNFAFGCFHPKDEFNGISMMETLLSIGLLGFVVVQGTRFFAVNVQTQEHIIVRGEVEDVRDLIRSSLDCGKTMLNQETLCGTTQFIEVRKKDSSVLIPKVTPFGAMGGGIEVRAQCGIGDGFYNLNMEYRRVANGVVIKDSMNGKMYDWAPLFGSIPITCTQGEYIESIEGRVPVKKCSGLTTVPGDANPYFAGSASTASITYPFSHGNTTDRATHEKPANIAPLFSQCLQGGVELYFAVGGLVDHGGGTPNSGADGNVADPQYHIVGPKFGKSDVRTPGNALVGVFLGAGSLDSSTPPPMLDFWPSSAQNYNSISPQIGQIFFIGDGKNNQGKLQKVVAPAGTTRLFLGPMDLGQWNNNGGSYKAAIYMKLGN